MATPPFIKFARAAFYIRARERAYTLILEADGPSAMLKNEPVV